ncbi:hypothetical protein LguiB_023926 [Lonicera macranthoides]
MFATFGYDIGGLAPGRCSSWMDNGCPAGDSAIEPYVVGHHMLLSHAASAKLYKNKYQESQKGQIGITLNSNWMVPYSDTKDDRRAAKRAIEFMYGWFIHPLTYGDYPRIMRTLVGKRLPKFTSEQAATMKGSFDFLGLNYYSANYVTNIRAANRTNISSSTDSLTSISSKLPKTLYEGW